MIQIKAGVRVRGMQPEILLAVAVAHEVYREQGSTLTLTSVTDGMHKVGSLHYTGCAIDLRLPALNVDIVAAALRSRLGAEYDVVLEKDHIHVEYDPR